MKIFINIAFLKASEKKVRFKQKRAYIANFRVAARVVLRLGTNLNIRGLVHNLLHRVLNELIERIQLLSYQTLLLEVGADNRPRILLRYLLFLFIVFFVTAIHLAHLSVLTISVLYDALN